MNEIRTGMRKAALMLSSLGEEDRAWLLARLNAEDRERLAPLVSEVRAMGIALDPQAVKGLVDPASRPAVPSRPIEAASAPSVFGALSKEPDWLIALLLRERAWPWREAFLQLLGTERRMRVRRARPAAVELPPRAAQALLERIEARLDDETVDAGEASEPESRGRPAAARGSIGRLWSGVWPWRR